ncbi:DUF2867 domain-containing protein [Butyricimonas faecihominis]|nr:DUF2867 domain-containing protein [Butyricimonas faecihominis]WOF10624.1 DUF2867 domain-containing protein [Butyricimonas faecihominis]
MMLRSRLIKKYFPANYKDCFRDKIYRKPYMSVNELFNLMFSQYPKWIMRMYYIRNLIVKPFGVKINKSFANMVIEQNENEIIIGAKDKHLTFHVSLFCSDVKDKTQEVSITTIVKYENILGRIYFAAIWLFHRIIVSYLFKRAIKIHNT